MKPGLVLNRVTVAIRFVAGVLLFTAVMLMILAAPGFLTDQASTVPVHANSQEAGR